MGLSKVAVAAMLLIPFEALWGLAGSSVRHYSSWCPRDCCTAFLLRTNSAMAWISLGGTMYPKESLWCAKCGKATTWLSVHGVCRTVGVTRRTVYNWIHRSWVHTRTMPNGWWLICQESLSEAGEVRLYQLTQRKIDMKTNEES
jgi:hypothetical protein